MKRTLGTVNTEKGLARLEHDSDAQTLVAVFPDGAQESVGDYYPTASWRNARRQLVSMYGNERAYHDTWVLCLRPVRALMVSRTEEGK